MLYSSLTVAGALSCLLVFPLRFLYSMGIGGALVALCAGAVSLLVLPAVLVALGPRIDALAPALACSEARRARRRPAERRRLVPARARRDAPPGRSSRSSPRVALLAIAAPSLRLQLAPADAHVLPSSSQSRQLAEALTHDFAVDGSQTITMVVHASPTGRVGRRARRSARRSRAGDAAGRRRPASAPPRYLGRAPGRSNCSRAAPTAPRQPGRWSTSCARSRPRPTLLVGGPTAWFVDQKSAIAAHVPLALLILALVTGGFLFLMTGSLVLPLMALRDEPADGRRRRRPARADLPGRPLSGLFGFSPIGGLEESNLVLLFVVAFALSTDYGVFLFARIKEAHDDGAARRATRSRSGSSAPAGSITAAALLFCVAIGAFVTSHIFFIKQLGLGAALAVAIDATSCARCSSRR